MYDRKCYFIHIFTLVLSDQNTQAAINKGTSPYTRFLTCYANKGICPSYDRIVFRDQIKALPIFFYILHVFLHVYVYSNKGIMPIPPEK